MLNAVKDMNRDIGHKIKKTLRSDAIFHDNEVQSNKLGGIILFATGIILAIIMFLGIINVFPLSNETIIPPTVQGIVEVAIILFICEKLNFDRWWLKYFLILGLSVVYARLDSMLTHKVAILMVIPIVFSCRYFSQRLTNYTGLLVTVLFTISAIRGATHGMINLNIVTMPEGTAMTATGGFLGDTVINAGVSPKMLITNTLLYDFFPKWLMFTIVALICSNIAVRGRQMILLKHESDLESARIESELGMASRIQENMLPNVFPAFPDRKEFDIYATMHPAKEVGGDFYDFFLIDDDHLYLAIADVSGKGVPGALFMMASMIILSNHATSGMYPADILTAANEAICANNREEMFVTVWLGILELSTGKLTTSNAGHEYPVIKHGDGNFELLKDRHGFVIGGMHGIKYKEEEFTLSPGDKIFVYTDGVPEATDGENRLFGTDRMVDSLNMNPDASPKEILAGVKNAVDIFVNGEEQFDDLTMLCIEYKG